MTSIKLLQDGALGQRLDQFHSAEIRRDSVLRTRSVFSTTFLLLLTDFNRRTQISASAHPPAPSQRMRTPRLGSWPVGGGGLCERWRPRRRQRTHGPQIFVDRELTSHRGEDIIVLSPAILTGSDGSLPSRRSAGCWSPAWCLGWEEQTTVRHGQSADCCGGMLMNPLSATPDLSICSRATTCDSPRFHLQSERCESL